MHVPADDWHSTFEAVRDALRNILGWNGDLLSGKTVQQALDVLSGARSAVDAALSAVLEEWNSARRDPVIGLPPELVCDCFRFLSFRDRLVVSHVSRAWRNAALADPWLWNDATVIYQRKPVAVDMVAALLKRSDPLPFAFFWLHAPMGFDEQKDLFDLVFQNMHRIESLEMDRCHYLMLAEVFSRPAALLRSLVVYSSDGRSMLPHDWAEGAPLLEVLKVGEFAIPHNFRPLVSVRSFAGSWGRSRFRPAVRVNLFEYLPGLRTLYLDNLLAEELKYLQCPPASLSDVTLIPVHGGFDYTPVFQLFNGLRILRLRLEHAREFSPAVQLFTSTVPGDWTMKIQRDTVTLLSDRGDAEYVISHGHRQTFARDLDFALCLAHLRSMTLPNGLLRELWMLDTWDRSLPTLRDVSVVFTSQSLMKIPADRPPEMRAPLLDTMRFVIHKRHMIWNTPYSASAWCEWITDLFPALLPLIFVRGTARLESIIIEAGDDVSPDEDFTSLQSIADNVCLKVGMQELRRG